MMKSLSQGTALALVLATGLPVVAPSARAQSAPAASMESYRWDAMRRMVGVIGAASSGTSGPFLAVRYTYDANGQVIRTETGSLSAWQDDTIAPSAWTGFTISRVETVGYDAAGNWIDRRLAPGATGAATLSVAQASYDANGRISCVANRMNMLSIPAAGGNVCDTSALSGTNMDRVVKYSYDPLGRVKQKKLALTASSEIAEKTYGYNAIDGLLTSMIDGNGNRTTSSYDGFDRAVRLDYPSTVRSQSFNPADQTSAQSTAGSSNSSDFQSRSLDRNGRVVSMRKRDGQTISLSYDALGRLTRKDVPGSSSDVDFSYDLSDRMLSALYPGGAGIRFTYDNADRLVSESDSSTGTALVMSYQYDSLGNRTVATWPDGRSIRRQFDNLHREVSVKNDSDALLLSRTYHANGLPQGVDRAESAFDQSLTFDGIARLSDLGITGGSAASRVAWHFDRNAAGQITAQSRDNDAYAWPAGSSVSRSYTVNGLNQYFTAGPATFCYDGNGSLSAELGVKYPTVYLYDSENRLVEARDATLTSCPTATAGYSGALRASLQYDPLGRLSRLVGTSSAATTRFLYEGYALVGEYDGPGNLTRRYIHGPEAGMDDPVIEFVGSSIAPSDARHLYADSLGSVVLSGDAGGNAVAINTYNEYGISGKGNQGRFQYTGQVWLSELGMYYYKARVYSPGMGRFLQVDPVGYADQMNLYAYVGNDPVNAVDPTGMVEEAYTPEIVVSNPRNDYGGFVRSNPFDTGPSYTPKVAPKLTGQLRDQKKLPPCAQAFLKGRIFGDPAGITIHNGGSIHTWLGHSVTYGSDIYQESQYYNGSSKDALWNTFHEIGHTSQNAKLGLSALHHAFAYFAFAGDGPSIHESSPLETNANQFADNTLAAYLKAGMDKSCPIF